MKKISVIIATYNAEKYIARALESIINCDECIIECIIVDGVSNDNTLNIIKLYKEKIDLTIISEKDKGIFDALNKGCNLAKGEYIYILGADDEIIPNGLKLLSKENNNSDIVYGKVMKREINGKLYCPKAKDTKMLKYNMPFSHQGMIMKTAILHKLGGFNVKYKLCADFDLVQRAYLNNASFKYVNTEIAYFSTEGASRVGIFKVDKEVRKICINNGVYRLFSFKHLYTMFRKLMKTVLLKYN